MKSSSWHAHGNVYLVHDGPATPADAEGTDGVVEVLAVDGRRVTIGISIPTARTRRCRATARASPRRG